MTNQEKDRGPGIHVPPPVLFLGCLGAALLLRQVAPLPFGPGPGVWSLGAVLAALSAALALSAGIVMHRRGTTVRPDRAPRVVVEEGPFRFTRNPMYVSLCLLLAALGLLVHDGWPLIFVVPLALLLHHTVILREERYLEARFGPAYLAFKRRVRRWL